MKFTISDDPPTTDVTFHAEIDDEGDLSLYANGHRLLFIACDDGNLHRVCLSKRAAAKLSGLAFDDDDRIVIAG